MKLGSLGFSPLSSMFVEGRRRVIKLQSSSLTLLVAWSLSLAVQAAPVEIYSSPAWVSGDGSTQVETIGILKYAYSAGYNVAYGNPIDVNGKEGKVVTFKTTLIANGASTTTLAPDIDFSPAVTRAARTGNYEPVAAITGNYRTALRDVYYVNVTPFSYTNTLKNLTAGHTYLVQIWASDGYGTGDRQVKYSLSVGSSTNSFQLDVNNGNVNKGEGQVATFKATAESTTMTLVLEAAGVLSNFSCFSAIQVRDVTQMYWTTSTGSWDTTGLNWDPAGDSETVWSSAIGSSVRAYFTNNATVTIAADVWAGDVNVASNTTIKRAASAGTTTLTVMRNVIIDAGRLLTIGSGTAGQQTALAFSIGLSGAVDVKTGSRIVLGNGALGQATAMIAGDGGNYFGPIQGVANGVAEWNGQITTVTGTRLGAGINGILKISGKVTGNSLAIRSGNTGGTVGTVVLSNVGNDYAGDTTIYSPLRIGCTNAVPVTSKWAFTSGVSNPSLDLNGCNQEVQSFTGTISGSNITNSNAVASELVVNTTADQTASALLLAGNVSVLKKGAAKLTLGMDNTYTGLTTIVAGTLALSVGGDIAQSASIQIYTNATLDVTAKTGYTIPKKVIATGGAVNLGVGKTLSFATDSVLEMPFPSGVLSGAALTVTGDADVASVNLVLTHTENFIYGQPYVILATPSGTISNLPASVPSGFIVKISADSKTLLLYRKGTIISFSS
jgi:autotransporter-associated beta strand protein